METQFTVDLSWGQQAPFFVSSKYKYKTKELTIIPSVVDFSYGSSVPENEEKLDDAINEEAGWDLFSHNFTSTESGSGERQTHWLVFRKKTSD